MKLDLNTQEVADMISVEEISLKFAIENGDGETAEINGETLLIPEPAVWHADDGAGGKKEIEATSAEDAARLYVDGAEEGEKYDVAVHRLAVNGDGELIEVDADCITVEA